MFYNKFLDYKVNETLLLALNTLLINVTALI